MEGLIFISLLLICGAICGAISLLFSLNSLFNRYFGLNVIKWSIQTKGEKNRYRKALLWLKDADTSVFQSLGIYLLFIESTVALLVVNLIVMIILVING